MKYNLASSMADRLNFDEAVRQYAAECVPMEQTRLPKKLLKKWRDSYFEGLEIDDKAEAIARFDAAFTEVYNSYR